jgi:fatty-acid desaturase
MSSFAHWVGKQEYSSSHTARGGFFLAVVTNGEGYHNFVSLSGI